ncbi:phenylpropionate dioxygenase-like ring-hydroxylating dioxygenase large terminal subunit [Sphingobium subterraneum]|uniref:Phenylpropionate dioxygenase-like ring-hydroxylating dioxygenase large terminal subunit n=1 Tax=Sphingobium subterraneum TaxID=627688 RepID=A0A841J4B6_9SPHN|nr:phenylpropionate dioxygenase-like ring-hydroxylating dioxygenase large terminal subunit [Sphingobium subterraneum]
MIGTDLADGRIVIYRGEDGAARAMSAFCKHMGADLSAGGDVVGNDIRCPYHHWAYTDGGRCSNIPSGDAIPRGSNLVDLPLREELGLIWVFFGETPLYDLPGFDEFDDEKHVYRAFEIELKSKLLVDPWIFTTNVFDVVHNRVVHGLNIADPTIEDVNPFLRRMTWDAAHTGEKATGDWRPDIEVFGTNSIRTRSVMDGRLKWYIAAMTPCGRQGTREFFTIITTKDEESEERLDKWQAMHNRFVNEDLPILNNMRTGDLRLVAADRAMGRFIQAAREYPRTSLDAMETAANRKRS